MTLKQDLVYYFLLALINYYILQGLIITFLNMLFYLLFKDCYILQTLWLLVNFFFKLFDFANMFFLF